MNKPKIETGFSGLVLRPFPLKRNRQTRRSIQNKEHRSESRMERTIHGCEDAKNPFGTKGALLYRGKPCMCVLRS
jgi:hypothetical protein